MMSQEKEFNPGFAPDNPKEEMRGLEDAIEHTKQKIADYEKSGADVSDLKLHLENLLNRWREAEKKTQKAA
jgi:hypothetical protein